ncbi:MAG: FAD-binding oxidoreductase [Chromatocurvus sp.]
MNQPHQVIEGLRERLADCVGNDFVMTDAAACQFYAQDVSTTGQPAVAVVQPGTTRELSAVVNAAVTLGCDVIPRGGGMSYTRGYVPSGGNAVMVDMSRMNRIVEINEQDMTVTVECGCTWAVLHTALEKEGLRTPYWGTLSGLKATIGGGLSQNSVFWGSGQHGTAADSVLSLEVVLADGSVLDTGSASQVNASPFFRHFGPDLTGVFTGDTGALGFKSRATLRLIPVLPAKEYLAFDFSDAGAAIAAMSDISRNNLASECFGFDPFLQVQRMKRQGLRADVKALAGVMKSSGSVLRGVKEGAKVALAGRRYMDDVAYSVQVIVEDRNAPAAAARAADVRGLCAQHGAREIENSIPKITRSNPFGPLNSMLGPEGERWLPVHGLFSHSRIQAAFDAVQNLLERHAGACARYDIGTGYLFATVATNCFLLEPVFFWPDEIDAIHEASVEPAHLARLKRFPANPEARAAVMAIRSEMLELFSELGASHLQIGKSYRYREGLSAAAWQLASAIKQAVDPNGRVNPGSLGFD